MCLKEKRRGKGTIADGSIDFSAPVSRRENLRVERESSKPQALADEVKREWRLMWRFRVDDKARAEGMANRDFELLFVDQGTVIVATRDFKLLDLRSILHAHEMENVERIVSPHPSVGGWRKFARTVLKQQSRAREWKQGEPLLNRKKNLQVKKCGRGWMHRRSRVHFVKK